MTYYAVLNTTNRVARFESCHYTVEAAEAAIEKTLRAVRKRNGEGSYLSLCIITVEKMVKPGSPLE